jgi:P pilus assembly chaperone PapD
VSAIQAEASQIKSNQIKSNQILVKPPLVAAEAKQQRQIRL